MDSAHFTDAPKKLGEPNDYADGQRAFQMAGTTFLPAHGFIVGTIEDGDNKGMLIQVALSTRSMLGNHLGIFLRMTPDGARELGNALLQDAQKVDEHVAAQAAAAIEAARNKGGAS